MNKTMTSLIGFGAGIAAAVYSQRQNVMGGRQWKKMRKRMMKTFR
ncbi:YrzQ family protein [Falsibacillus pallidus]